MSAPPLLGFKRGDGRFGVRNHVLVLPSVVCSSHVAFTVAGDGGEEGEEVARAADRRLADEPGRVGPGRAGAKVRGRHVRV